MGAGIEVVKRRASGRPEACCTTWSLVDEGMATRGGQHAGTTCTVKCWDIFSKCSVPVCDGTDDKAKRTWVFVSAAIRELMRVLWPRTLASSSWQCFALPR